MLDMSSFSFRLFKINMLENKYQILFWAIFHRCCSIFQFCANILLENMTWCREAAGEVQKASITHLFFHVSWSKFISFSREKVIKLVCEIHQKSVFLIHFREIYMNQHVKCSIQTLFYNKGWSFQFTFNKQNIHLNFFYFFRLVNIRL